jgi:hypothetical protein
MFELRFLTWSCPEQHGTLTLNLVCLLVSGSALQCWDKGHMLSDDFFRGSSFMTRWAFVGVGVPDALTWPVVSIMVTCPSAHRFCLY